MSCYEWESGTIKLPAKEYGRVLHEVREAHDREMEKRLTAATRLYDGLKALKVTTREQVYRFPRPDAVDRLLETEAGRELYLLFDNSKPITPKDRIRKPRRKDYAPATSKTVAFNADEASAVFIKAARSIEWHVSENNHARERGRSTWLGRVLFTALGRVQWVRGTGGKIIGNDEYNRDARGEGGGGNYVVQAFPADQPAGAGRRWR